MKFFYKMSILLLVMSAVYSCKKEAANNKPTNTSLPPTSTGNTPGTLVKGTDPDVASTQGFFLTNSWQSNTFALPTGTSLHPDQVAAHLAANWVRYNKGLTKYWETKWYRR